MQDVIAELLRAPVWVHVPLAALAAGMAVFLIVPGMQRRRYSRQFVALARGFEREVVPGEASFSALAAGRGFEISHLHRSGTGSIGTMRGPRGTLIMTTTPLSSPTP